MARKRLVDPMATVDGVSRRALGVATQAEADAEAAELRRYRDTDEARREAPVVAGSTADGTALQSVIAALTGKGSVVDASETVEDEVTTGSVVADDLQVDNVVAKYVGSDAFSTNGGTITVTNGTADFAYEYYDPGPPPSSSYTLKASINATTGNVMVGGNLSVYGRFTDDIVFASGADRLIDVDTPSGTTPGYDLQIEAGNANGGDQLGGDLYLRSGQHTGNATAPTIYLQTANKNSGSGNTLRNRATRVTVNDARTTISNLLSPAGGIDTINGTAATPSALTAVAGTGASATASPTCADLAGTFYISTGSSPSGTGAFARLTFGASKGSANFTVLVTGHSALGSRVLSVARASNGNYFDVHTSAALSGSTNYTLSYLVIDH